LCSPSRRLTARLINELEMRVLWQLLDSSSTLQLGRRVIKTLDGEEAMNDTVTVDCTDGSKHFPNFRMSKQKKEAAPCDLALEKARFEHTTSLQQLPTSSKLTKEQIDVSTVLRAHHVRCEQGLLQEDYVNPLSWYLPTVAFVVRLLHYSVEASCERQLDPPIDPIANTPNFTITQSTTWYNPRMLHLFPPFIP
jgi:hypothetical protein